MTDEQEQIINNLEFEVAELHRSSDWLAGQLTRAEAEVERLRTSIDHERLLEMEQAYADERALADRLAEALRCPCISWPYRCEKHAGVLAAYEEARNERS